jgi:hypothetical protein
VPITQCVGFKVIVIVKGLGTRLLRGALRLLRCLAVRVYGFRDIASYVVGIRVLRGAGLG